MMIIMKQDADAKLKQIVDSMLAKGKAKVQMKLDNIEVSHNKEIKHITIRLSKATTDRQKKMWMQKLEECQDLEAYKDNLLDQLESYN